MSRKKKNAQYVTQWIDNYIARNAECQL